LDDVDQRISGDGVISLQQLKVQFKIEWGSILPETYQKLVRSVMKARGRPTKY